MRPTTTARPPRCIPVEVGYLDASASLPAPDREGADWVGKTVRTCLHPSSVGDANPENSGNNLHRLTGTVHGSVEVAPNARFEIVEWTTVEQHRPPESCRTAQIYVELQAAPP